MGSCTIENPILTIDWSLSGLDTGSVAFVFGGALLVWATGLGVGLLINIIRRFRV